MRAASAAYKYAGCCNWLLLRYLLSGARELV